MLSKKATKITTFTVNLPFTEYVSNQWWRFCNCLAFLENMNFTIIKWNWFMNASTFKGQEFGKVWVFWESHKIWKNLRATRYSSKSWRRFFKVNVVKSYYTNFNFFSLGFWRNWRREKILLRFLDLYPKLRLSRSISFLPCISHCNDPIFRSSITLWTEKAVVKGAFYFPSPFSLRFRDYSGFWNSRWKTWGNTKTLLTPARTPRISGLKSQVLKTSFLN